MKMQEYSNWQAIRQASGVRSVVTVVGEVSVMTKLEEGGAGGLVERNLPFYIWYGRWCPSVC